MMHPSTASCILHTLLVSSFFRSMCARNYEIGYSECFAVLVLRVLCVLYDVDRAVGRARYGLVLWC